MSVRFRSQTRSHRKREQLVAERVAEEKRALVTAGHEARAENGIRIFVKKQFHHLQQVARMIFQIGVVDYHQFRVHVRERACESPRLCPCFFRAAARPN